MPDLDEYHRLNTTEERIEWALKNLTRKRPARHFDLLDLDWDYEPCGSYRNSDWGDPAEPQSYRTREP